MGCWTGTGCCALGRLRRGTALRQNGGSLTRSRRDAWLLLPSKEGYASYGSGTDHIWDMPDL